MNYSKTCPYCGSEVAADQSFCPQCGQAVAQAAPVQPVYEQPVQPVQPVYEQPQYQQPQYQQPVYEQPQQYGYEQQYAPEKKSNAKKIAIIAGVVVVAILAIYFLFGSGLSKEEKQILGTWDLVGYYDGEYIPSTGSKSGGKLVANDDKTGKITIGDSTYKMKWEYDEYKEEIYRFDITLDNGNEFSIGVTKLNGEKSAILVLDDMMVVFQK